MIRTEIVDAIHTTQHFNPVYWAKTLQQRAGLNENGDINEHRAGSYYPDYNSTQLETALLMAFGGRFIRIMYVHYLKPSQLHYRAY